MLFRSKGQASFFFFGGGSRLREKKQQHRHASLASFSDLTEDGGRERGAYLVVHDLAVGLHQRLGVKRGLAIEHLVHAHPQGPPVALGAVLPHAVLHGLQDLRGNVVRSADSY